MVRKWQKHNVFQCPLIDAFKQASDNNTTIFKNASKFYNTYKVQLYNCGDNYKQGVME